LNNVYRKIAKNRIDPNPGAKPLTKLRNADEGSKENKVYTNDAPATSIEINEIIAAAFLLTFK
jgi:hypothetical protein